MTADNSARGSCLCGKVHFEVQLPSKWCGHCHCSLCRKAHGAGYVTWVGFQSEQFRLTSGEDSLKWFTSSAGARRGFCSDCGSTLLFEADRWPGETHVALGCFDDEIDRLPQANSFFDTHVNWMPINESLKTFSG